ncbi:MAG: C25 family cysteine peptidase [Pseudomonadota bacterium]
MYSRKIQSIRALLAAATLMTAGAQAAVVNLDWDTAVFPTGGSDINYGVGTVNFNLAHTGAQPASRPIEAGTYSASGGFGAGNSILYGANAGVPVTVDLTFSEPVTSLQLSLYDVDNADVVTVSAFNGATNISGSVGLAAESGTPTFTLAGTTATGAGANSPGNSTNGTLNVTVPGPLTRLQVVGSTTAATSFLFSVSDLTVTTPDPPAAICSTALSRLDWDNQAYPAGDLSPSFNVADVAPFPDVVFDFAHSGNTADLGVDSPGEVLTFTNTASIGGGGAMINYFHDPDPNSDSQRIGSVISFSDTLQDVRFSIADIDSNVVAEDFADQVTIVGLLPGGGTVAPIFEAVSSGATYGFSGTSVNAHVGFDDGTDDSPRSAVNVYFDQDIVGIQIDYDDLGPNTWDSSRAVLLSDVLYCPPSSVPVTLSFFTSKRSDGGVLASWQTASQSMHAGFELRLLNGAHKTVASKTVATNHQWSTEVENYAAKLAGGGDSLLLLSHDIDGAVQEFGPFTLGSSHGARLEPNPINWDELSGELADELALRGLRHKAGSGLERTLPAGAKGGAQAVWLEVSATGIHRVSFEDLAAAGADFGGVSADQLALSFRGEGVARWVNVADSGSGFSPGDSIDFLGQQPSGLDGLYLNSYRYRLDLNSALVVPGQALGGRGQGVAPATYQHVERIEENNEYQPAHPTDDPWFDQELSTFGSGFSDVMVPVSRLAAGQARLRLDLVGLTDFTTAPDPDHHIQASFNGGSVFIDARTDGLTEWVLEAPVPAGDLFDGDNTLRLELPGDTGFPFDIVNLEAYTLTYPREFVAINDQLTFDAAATTLAVSGYSTDQLVAYAMDESGTLLKLEPSLAGSAPDFSAVLAGAGADPESLFRSGFEDGDSLSEAPDPVPATYYVSTEARLARPTVSVANGSVAVDVSASTTYLIIAHPAFIGAELDAYVAVRRTEGFNVQVVGVEDIYERYAFGMALPSAITEFVRQSAAAAPLGHVLLVGADSFDYRNFSGVGSISFIPTTYAPTNKFVNYTPSDGLLVDVDGDEVPDLPVGRWPVRSVAELGTLVDKTLAYDSSGLAAAQKAALVAGLSDPTIPPFFQQAQRLGTRLLDAGGTPWSSQTEVFVDALGVAPAQQALLDAINDGQTMTIYSGHGAADMWAFEGLLTPSLASTLSNAGEPTLIMPLTCYTTYFVDPSSNTLAYALLNGGDWGAAAVHGAATLSIYGDNEALGSRIVDDMLLNGFTLGQAINAAKRDLSRENFSRYRPVIINWALLGDPTLKVIP